ncbi:hypothetical protein KPH14_008974 [Odynerus spinipes]|uniref:Uncharacterized protein n=1 Tax=Odynerus spinipes TaxID=1348599 RepID=A0AAD9RPF9_9HYME|nr:hypothetical protein KPH14_008974 [Odynerus spinipes]
MFLDDVSRVSTFHSSGVFPTGGKTTKTRTLLRDGVADTAGTGGGYATIPTELRKNRSEVLFGAGEAGKSGG